MWTKAKVAKTIDHSALKPYLGDDDILEACRIGKEYGTATVCVRPSDVAFAARELEGSDVKAATTVGFPHGANRTEVKVLEARLAIEDGARELDMVMNIGRFLSGNYDYVKDDIEAVVEVAHANGVPLKVIFEICYLTPEQIDKASRTARDAGADFVKTSTGFGEGPATPEAVDIMIKAVGDVMGVKAAGGVRTWETAVGFLEQGCTRLGAVQTKKILDEATEP